MSNLDDENAGNVGTIIPGEGAPEPQAQVGGEDRAPADDIEARARAQGWVSKEEFRGPEDKWRPADEFVRIGEENLPVLRERTKTLASKLAEAEARIADMGRENADKFSRLERMSAAALSKQREQIEASYSAAKRDAVNLGDTVRYDQLDRDHRTAIAAHDREYVDIVARPPPQQQQPQMPPVVQQWVERNPWYVNDPEMQAVAQLNSQIRAKDTPGITMEQNLVETERYMRQRYPEKFPAAKREASGGPSVESGSRFASAAPRSKGISELPADAKSQGEKFVKQGLFKDMNEYARDYWSQ